MTKKMRSQALGKRWVGQRGFTLYELLLTVVVVGLVGGAVASVFPMLISLNQVEYELRQKRINLAIASAIEEWAKIHGTGAAQLPAPFTGTASSVEYNSAILDPSATTGSSPQLMELIRRKGVKPEEVLRSDGKSNLQRVYQRLSGALFEEVPLLGATGPRVRLSYDVGVVYTSDCGVPCTDALPGASVALSSTNRFTWAPAATDTGEAFVSTLPIERDKLGLLGERMRTLTTRMTAYFNTKVTETAPPDTRTNHFPAYGGSAAAGSNNRHGCNGAWYPLTAAELNPLGLPVNEYATTPWGGQIQYCRDYAPDGTPSGEVPHFAALRINANLSSGANPSNTTCSASTNNCSVILTF